MNIILDQKTWRQFLRPLACSYLIFIPATVNAIHFAYPTFWANYMTVFSGFLTLPNGGENIFTFILRYILSTGWYFFQLLFFGWGMLYLAALLILKRTLINRHNTQANWIFFGFSILLTLYGFYTFTPFDINAPVEHPAYALTKYWPAVVLFLWLPFYNRIWDDKKLLCLLCLSLALAALTPLGTNTNYMNVVSLSGGVFGALLALWIITLHRTYPSIWCGQRMVIFCCIASLIGTALLHEKLLNYRRSAPLAEQTAVIQTGVFNGLHVTPDLRDAITSLQTTLAQTSFDKAQDAVFAYADIPGYLTAIGVKSFAESWTITGYPVSNYRACFYIEQAQVRHNNPRHVYLLQSQALPLHIQHCFNNIVEPTEYFQTYPAIPAGYHYRNKTEYSLTLSGPYTIKKSTMP